MPVAVVWDNTAYECQSTPIPRLIQTGANPCRDRIASEAISSDVADQGDKAHRGKSHRRPYVFSDSPPELGPHEYTLTALDSLGGESLPAGPLELTVGDFVAPEPPLNLVATVDVADVQLTWTASPSLDVVGYRIYRDGEVLAEVGSTTYLDVGVENGLHVYQVLAVDDASNESDSLE